MLNYPDMPLKPRVNGHWFKFSKMFLPSRMRS